VLSLILGEKNMAYKNVGNELKPNADEKGLLNPENLVRFGDRSKRTTKSHLTRGAFGQPRHRRVSDEKVNEEQSTENNPVA
jgi:hypothetical protein